MFSIANYDSVLFCHSVLFCQIGWTQLSRHFPGSNVQFYIRSLPELCEQSALWAKEVKALELLLIMVFKLTFLQGTRNVFVCFLFVLFCLATKRDTSSYTEGESSTEWRDDLQDRQCCHQQLNRRYQEIPHQCNQTDTERQTSPSVASEEGKTENLSECWMVNGDFYKLEKVVRCVGIRGYCVMDT